MIKTFAILLTFFGLFSLLAYWRISSDSQALDAKIQKAEEIMRARYGNSYAPQPREPLMFIGRRADNTVDLVSFLNNTITVTPVIPRR